MKKVAYLILSMLLTSVKVSGQERLTNLPTYYLETYDGLDITSRTDYKWGSLTIVDDAGTRFIDSLRIRGRGNSSWLNMKTDKKPYRLKFNTKTRLLGQPYASAKNWVLLANADDKSLIRNALSQALGKWIGLPYNPPMQPVDLYINNEYYGTYDISDKIDVRKRRVNVEEQELMVRDDTTNITGGYLLEVDGFKDTDATYFSTLNGVNIRIHSPEPDSIVERQISYISEHVQKFEDCLYEDPVGDFRTYVDTTTMLQWYLASEITANLDAFWSIYIYKQKDDPRLYWGPLWDFDIAYNNTTRAGDVSQSLMADVGFGKSVGKKWVLRLWEDGWWKNAVKNHYETIYNNGLTEFMINAIDSMATNIRTSADRNFERWDINKRVYEELELFNSYEEYTECLKTFVRKHNDYLLEAFENRAPTPPTAAFTADTAYYYRLVTRGDASYVMDVVDQNSTEGAQVCLYENLPLHDTQEWIIRQIGNRFMFINAVNGLALSDYNNSEPYSYSLVLYQPDEQDYRQLWEMVAVGREGFYNIYNTSTGRIIDIRHATYKNGTEIVSYTPSSKDSLFSNRLWLPDKDELIHHKDSADADSTITPTDSTSTGILANQALFYALRYAPTAKTLRIIANDRTLLDFDIHIYSLQGRRVKTFRASDECSVAELPSGIYIVNWVTGGTGHSAKLKIE